MLWNHGGLPPLSHMENSTVALVMTTLHLKGTQWIVSAWPFASVWSWNFGFADLEYLYYSTMLVFCNTSYPKLKDWILLIKMVWLIWPLPCFVHFGGIYNWPPTWMLIWLARSFVVFPKAIRTILPSLQKTPVAWLVRDPTCLELLLNPFVLHDIGSGIGATGGWDVFR